MYPPCFKGSLFHYGAPVISQTKIYLSVVPLSTLWNKNGQINCFFNVRPTNIWSSSSSPTLIADRCTCRVVNLFSEPLDFLFKNMICGFYMGMGLPRYCLTVATFEALFLMIWVPNLWICILRRIMKCLTRKCHLQS